MGSRLGIGVSTSQVPAILGPCQARSDWIDLPGATTVGRYRLVLGPSERRPGPQYYSFFFFSSLESSSSSDTNTCRGRHHQAATEQAREARALFLFAWGQGATDLIFAPSMRLSGAPANGNSHGGDVGPDLLGRPSGQKGQQGRQPQGHNKNDLAVQLAWMRGDGPVSIAIHGRPMLAMYAGRTTTKKVTDGEGCSQISYIPDRSP